VKPKASPRVFLTSEEYLLIVRSPDGTERVEQFADSVSFKLRLESLEKQLDTEEWQSRGVRMLRDGWKI
jgi:hypothetical protein